MTVSNDMFAGWQQWSPATQAEVLQFWEDCLNTNQHSPARLAEIIQKERENQALKASFDNSRRHFKPIDSIEHLHKTKGHSSAIRVPKKRRNIPKTITIRENDNDDDISVLHDDSDDEEDGFLPQVRTVLIEEYQTNDQRKAKIRTSPRHILMGKSPLEFAFEVEI